MTESPDQKSSWQEGFPSQLQPLLREANWDAVTIGRSGMHVFHVADGYLKIAPQGLTPGNDLHTEKMRLEWLKGRLPVPQIYYYGKNASFEYLYLSEIQGTMACDRRFQEDMPSLIALLAEALHMVHAVEAQSCPFTRPLQPRLEEIQQSISRGHIDNAKFVTDHQGLSPQARYEQLERLLPASNTLSFTHGDFCLPNIIIDRQKRRINGLIDWGYGGIADHHEDLASACWSLGYNFASSWIPSLLAAYGLESIDQKRLTFYQLLDDLSHYYFS
ncbi:MAG: aminoglycoside 3'-phosphotransferase [Ktedonobacteraceae bacterium]|nr:aminoglycoside 3'-phosphotransferase [Ktedonobacteraceae bacterium]